MRPIFSAILLFILVACHETKPLELPPADGAQTALLVVTDVGLSRYEILVIDLTGARSAAEVAVTDRDDAFVLHYAETPAELRLTPGVQPPPKDKAIVRRLPPTSTLFRLAPHEASYVSATPAELTDVFERVALPTPSDKDCRTAGCIALEVRDNGGFEPVCRIPCSVAPAAVMPPSPEPPVLTPCPEGWGEVAPVLDDDVVQCRPPDPLGCPDGRAQFLGRNTCDDLGDCTLTAPDNLPAGRPVRYVDDDAVQGGDGTIARPYDSLVSAMTGAPFDVVLALLPGTYTDNVVMGGGTIDVIGTCAANTRIVGSNVTASLSMTNGTLNVRRVAVINTQPSTPAIAQVNGTLSLEDVEIGANGVAVEIEGASATATRVKVLPGPNRGLRIDGANASLNATDLLIRGRKFAGIKAQNGASLDLARLEIDGVDGEGGTHDLRGRGVFADRVPTVSIATAHVRGARETPVAIWGETTVTLVDLVLDTEATPADIDVSNGIDLHLGVDATINRVNIEGPSTRGLWMFGSSELQTVNAQNVRIVGTTQSGVVAWPMTTAIFDRILVADAGVSAVFARVASVTLTNATLVRVRDVEMVEDNRYKISANAAGLRIVDDGTIHATRVYIADVDGVGAEVGWETSVRQDLENLMLLDSTIERAAWGGVHVYRGTATLQRVLMKDIGFAAVLAYSRPLKVVDVVIDGVTKQTIDIPPNFAPPGIDDQRNNEVIIEYRDRNGSGLTVGGFGNLFNGVLDAERVRVVRAASAGVHIANNSQSRLVDIEVVDSAVGEEVVFGGKVDVEGVVFRGVTLPLVEP